MRILALDLSSKTGWALFNGERLVESGHLPKVEVVDFNVNNHPNKSKFYPKNIFDAAYKVADDVRALVRVKEPELIVIENSVKGRNRHTQRFIEWMHFCVFAYLSAGSQITYMDPSEWRRIVDLRLSKADKDNNKSVKKGEKRGKITRKHLSVRMANELFSKELKIKDNDEADAILLGYAASRRG